MLDEHQASWAENTMGNKGEKIKRNRAMGGFEGQSKKKKKSKVRAAAVEERCQVVRVTGEVNNFSSRI